MPGFLASKAAKLVAGVGLTAGVTVGVAAGVGALGGSDALRVPSVGQPISGYAVEVLALSIQLEEAFLDSAASSDAATVEQALLAFADDALALDPPQVPFAAHTRLVTALEMFVAGFGEPTATFLIEPTEEVEAALDRLTQDALAEHDADPLARYLSARIEIGAPSDDVLQAYGVLFSNFAAFPGAVAFRDFLPVFAEARAALEAERSRLAALTPPREAEPLHDRTLVAYRELIDVVTADAVVFEEFLTDVQGPAPLPTGLADRLILLRARAEDAVFELGLLALEENELALRVLLDDAR